jgi:hypothetical protein
MVLLHTSPNGSFTVACRNLLHCTSTLRPDQKPLQHLLQEISLNVHLIKHKQQAEDCLHVVRPECGCFACQYYKIQHIICLRNNTTRITKLKSSLTDSKTT